jgi:hypothetical protein
MESISRSVPDAAPGTRASPDIMEDNAGTVEPGSELFFQPEDGLNDRVNGLAGAGGNDSGHAASQGHRGRRMISRCLVPHRVEF